ncbi:hypothetical protein [Paraburkholderia acidiphila]|uniref:Lipoprotein n=1 Tax=Paraburkholderia acidiphila TaxID=2571747 RepID=A0A7Z2GE08_9BURK|nr:hypothetical protein [Paraburkholderia acidiphila]QGZ59759.1 hypothetical protein FAZ97_32870 [Paraburkholderia acidiphila]
MSASERFGGGAQLPSRITQSLPKVLISLAAACTVLAGCASTSNVTAADRQDTFVVSASASGGRLAWARAHKRAVTAASDYCENRGMQASLGIEQMDGFEALQQQGSTIRFECHPKL